jgi:hypothetical protein
MRGEQLAERLDHVGGIELAGHTDGQAFAAEFVDDAQHPERFAVVSAAGDEVIGAGVIGPLGP